MRHEYHATNVGTDKAGIWDIGSDMASGGGRAQCSEEHGYACDDTGADEQFGGV